MFLTKKTGGLMNKPKTNEGVKPKRVLGGWDDDEEESRVSQMQQQVNVETKSKLQPVGFNLLQEEGITDLTLKKASSFQTAQNHVSKKSSLLNWDQLNDRNDIDCEKKLIENIVSQSGGIRQKPTDGMLSDLLKEIRGMDVNTIGSLLLSKIEVNYPYLIKVKTLYTIEFLVKKNPEYLAFFKAHAEKLKEYPEPEDNAENYRKLLRVVLNYMGVAETAQYEEKKTNFVDPQYNDQPAKSNIATFLHDNANKGKKEEPKRPIIGPGQTKNHPKQTNLTALQPPKKAVAVKVQSQELNLLQMDESKRITGQMQELNLLF